MRRKKAKEDVEDEDKEEEEEEEEEEREDGEGEKARQPQLKGQVSGGFLAGDAVVSSVKCSEIFPSVCASLT